MKWLKRIIPILFFIPAIALAQNASLWYLSGGNVRPNVSTWGVQIPSLANQNCLGANGGGVLQAGSCGGSGTVGPGTSTQIAIFINSSTVVGYGTLTYVSSTNSFVIGSTTIKGDSTDSLFGGGIESGGELSLYPNSSLTGSYVGIYYNATGSYALDDGRGSGHFVFLNLDPTANRTITIPDASGTIVLGVGTSSLSLWNGSGTLVAYAGASCPGQAVQTINADGSVSCVSVTASGSATTTINGANGPTFNFIASSTNSVLSITSSTSGASSTIKFILDLSSFLTKAVTSINGATSSAHTFAAGSGIQITDAASSTNSTTTITNIGVTSLVGQGCVTAGNSTGSVSLTVTCISANQLITFSLSQDATGTATGTTAINVTSTVVGLQGKALPSLATGTLYYKSGAWSLGNAVDASGNQYVTSTGISSVNVNGFSGTAFTLQGSGNVTSTLNNGSTTFSLINSGVASGTYNCANITVASSGLLTSAAGGTCGVSSVTGSNSIVVTGSATPNVSLASSTASGTIFIGSGNGQWAIALPTSTSPLTWTYASGSLSIGCATCQTGNQTITLTISGDATGTASGATSIADSLTVTGLQGKALPALATGTLQYIDGAWRINNATSALALFNASGTLLAFGGSSLTPASGCLTSVSISATGTLSGATSTCSGGSAVTSLNGFTNVVNLAAGANITISTSTGGGSSTITIASTGGGSLSTSSAITLYHFPYWASTTGQLAGTSTLTINVGSSTINASGTITLNGEKIAAQNNVLSVTQGYNLDVQEGIGNTTSSWTDLGNINGASDIRFLSYAGNGIGIAVGDEMNRTTDYFKTFTSSSVPFSESLVLSSDYIGNSTFVIGTFPNGHAGYSTDNAKTWNDAGSIAGGSHIYAIKGVGSSTVLAGLYSDSQVGAGIARSTNNGRTYATSSAWANMCGNWVASIAVGPNGQVVVGCANSPSAGVIWYSSDRGATYSASTTLSSNDQDVDAVQYVPGMGIWIAGTYPKGDTFYSYDGKTWFSNGTLFATTSSIGSFAVMGNGIVIGASDITSSTLIISRDVRNGFTKIPNIGNASGTDTFLTSAGNGVIAVGVRGLGHIFRSTELYDPSQIPQAQLGASGAAGEILQYNASGDYANWVSTSSIINPALASSSVTFGWPNATTSQPQALNSIKTNSKKTITKIDCWEEAAATTTIEVFYNTTLASSGFQQVILSSIACGSAGTSVTSFTTSTLPANSWLWAIVSSTAGTPTQTWMDIEATKQ